MFDNRKVKELVLSVLVADAYCLGTHWIYDEKQLQDLEVNWEELNDAKAIWHKGKCAGEFTHYGDQTLWLYQFLQDKESFDVQEYTNFWKIKIDSYNGYIDGATRDTLENIKNGITPTGSKSTDLSIVGRISPLLLVSKTKEEFLKNVEEFVKITHNSNEAIETAKFFAKLLLEVIDGKEIVQAMSDLKEKFDSKIQSYVQKGIDSKEQETFETIREFGPACGIEDGFSGVVHLLSKYTSYKEMLIENAKAGGDSSARAMSAVTIYMAQPNKNVSRLPQSWLAIKATII